MKKLLISIMLIALLVSTIFINYSNAEMEPFYNFTGMYIKTSEAKPGDKVYVDLFSQFTSNDQIIVYLENTNRSSQKLNAEIKDIDLQSVGGQNPYFILPENTKVGDTYEMTNIEVKSSNGSLTYTTRPGSNLYTNCLGKKYVKVIGNEEELALKNISIKGSTQYKESDKIYLDVQTSGKVEDYGMSVVIRDITSGVNGAITYVQDLNGNPYLDLQKSSEKINSGEHYISDVFLLGENDQCLHYSNYTSGSDVLPLTNDVRFTIVSDDSKPNTETNSKEVISLKSFNIDTTIAKQNERVSVKLSSDKKLSQVMLTFIDRSNNNTMIVYLKGLKDNSPYFVVPYTTELGTYELDYAILKDVDGNNTHYRKGEETADIKHFDFNSAITVEKSEESKVSLLYLENDDLTMDIINEILKADDSITVEVNADNNPIIDKALFEAIKGSYKTVILHYKDVEWIFNGKDIEEAKSIDLSTSIYKSSSESDAKINQMLVNPAVILEFAENGRLPGKCLIRVHTTEDMAEVLNKESTNVYYYNDSANNFNKVKMQTILSDGDYYEFYINHNSKYVLTKNEIDSVYVSSITSDLELNDGSTEALESAKPEKSTSFISNLASNKTLLKQFAIIIVCIIILVLIAKGKILANKDSKKDKE